MCTLPMGISQAVMTPPAGRQPTVIAVVCMLLCVVWRIFAPVKGRSKYLDVAHRSVRHVLFVNGKDIHFCVLHCSLGNEPTLSIL